MKILITGCSGYLGQHFLYHFLQKSKKDEIHAIFSDSKNFEKDVRSHPTTCSLVERMTNISFNSVDLTNRVQLDQFFENHKDRAFDICFHFAALSSPQHCHKNREKARAINVPRHLFDKLRDTTLVALSTDQVYCGTKAPYGDEAEINPVNEYGQTKAEMEDVILSDKSRCKPAICLRSSIILGPHAPYGNAHSTFLHFCQSRQDQETIFFIDEIRSVVFVGDVVNVLLFFYHAVKSGDIMIPSRAYNMGGPDAVSRMDIARAVAQKLGFSINNWNPAAKSDLNVSEADMNSPLNISMISVELEQFVHFRFYGLDELIARSF